MTGTDDATRRDVAHLLRRAGFGGTVAQIDALSDLGYEGAVDTLVSPLASGTADPTADAIAAPAFDTASYLALRNGTQEEQKAAGMQVRAEGLDLVVWSVQRMAAATHPLREKLTFLWHDHFATGIEKVKIPQLMYDQYRTFRDLGGGRFDELVNAVARDPAMLIWLDGRESTAKAPNENFARELFELFTLGHQAPAGASADTDGTADHDRGGTADHGTGQPYTEADIADAARALTGWTIDPNGAGGVLRPARHDTGTKSVLGTTGALGLDDVVRAATSQPASAPHVVAALWSRLARPARPDDPVVTELAAPFARDLDITALVRSILLHPQFRADASRSGLVKMPVEYVVGIHRALGVTPTVTVLITLNALGQIPFAPPDVSGWTANEGWLSTASSLSRLQLAARIDPGAALDPVIGADPADRPAALAHLLGVDGWSASSEAALRAVDDDPRTMLTVALVAPEYVLN